MVTKLDDYSWTSVGGKTSFSNGNWTEWSTIQGVIGRVISNRPSAQREDDLKLRARVASSRETTIKRTQFSADD